MPRISIRHHLVPLGKAFLHRLHFRHFRLFFFFFFILNPSCYQTFKGIHPWGTFVLLFLTEWWTAGYDSVWCKGVCACVCVCVCVCVCLAERDRGGGAGGKFQAGKAFGDSSNHQGPKEKHSFLTILHFHSLLFSYFFLFVPLPSQGACLWKSCTLSSI